MIVKKKIVELKDNSYKKIVEIRKMWTETLEKEFSSVKTRKNELLKTLEII